jgi:hypothetical protein
MSGLSWSNDAAGANYPGGGRYDDADSVTAKTIRLIRAEGHAAGYAEAVALLRSEAATFIPPSPKLLAAANFLEHRAEATKETTDHA